MRALLASLTQAIIEALPLTVWLTLDVPTLRLQFADAPRKRKPQRIGALTGVLRQLAVTGG